MRFRFPWFTLCAQPRGERLRCAVEMFVHEWVTLRWGHEIAHARPRSIRYAIGFSLDPPADFAAVAAVQSRDGEGECGVDAIGYAALTWTATALGDDFVRYEIQRSLDDEETWADIATVISEDLDEFGDYEAPRGVEACYRIRTIGAGPSMLGSVWSSTECVTIPPVHCEWLFVSNLRPDLNVGVQVRPEREYRFPTTNEIVVKELWGRDFHATFRPLEQRGVMIALSVTAEIFTSSGSPGVRAFDALRAMFEEPSLPYVCTLDPYGNQFFSTVVIVVANETQPGDQYHADLTVIQITDQPYPVLASASLIWRNAELWRGAQTWRGVV